jgi:hypothetical protein
MWLFLFGVSLLYAKQTRRRIHHPIKHLCKHVSTYTQLKRNEQVLKTFFKQNQLNYKMS